MAQAELEDRELPGAYHRIALPRARRRRPVEIETTRPELLPACVALVAHPDDERYQPLFGTDGHARRCSASRCRSLAHPLAEPEKGTGIAMICTFGDLTDVIWWRELDLPVRAVIGRDGRLLAEPPDRRRPTPAAALRRARRARRVKQARQRIVELLARVRRPRSASPGRSPTR